VNTEPFAAAYKLRTPESLDLRVRVPSPWPLVLQLILECWPSGAGADV